MKRQQDPRSHPGTCAAGLRVLARFVVVLGLGQGLASACSDAPDLRAVLEGTAVRLTWTGALDPGDTWALYNTDLFTWQSGGPVPGTALYTGVDAEFSHDVVADPFYRARCEGPGGEGPWSNMGFRLQRRFHTVNSPQVADALVSLPLFSGFPDVGGGGGGWPCEEPGDGANNLDDVLCALWTDRELVSDGRFTVEMLDPATRSFASRIGIREASGPFRAIGSRLDRDHPDRRGLGVLLRIDGDPVENLADLVGAHDPGFAGVQIDLETGGRPKTHVVSVPYHAMYRTADEVLCGLEGVDWFRDPGTGNPDTCEGGLFSHGDGTTGSLVSVVRLDDVQRLFVARTVSWVDFIGEAIFAGEDFDLVPGEALLVHVDGDYEERTFLPPTW